MKLLSKALITLSVILILYVLYFLHMIVWYGLELNDNQGLSLFIMAFFGIAFGAIWIAYNNINL